MGELPSRVEAILSLPDPLNVRRSAVGVMRKAVLVEIDFEKLSEVKDKVSKVMDEDLLTEGQFGSLAVSPQKVLVMDAVNFCFWSGKDEERWKVEYPEGEAADGWWGLVACFDRAIEGDTPILEVDYLKEISLNEVKRILKGVDEIEIPLIEERWKFLQETGRILAEKFGGQAINLIEEAKFDAVEIAEKVIGLFSSFRDTAEIDGKEVSFYKRAQILAYDLSLLSGVELNNLDKLTIFADYKLPQLLRALGVLVYDRALAEKVDNYVLIPKGSQEEIEIRAATILTGEVLASLLKIPPVTVDNALWSLSQKVTGMKPYHRTLTTSY